MTILDEERSNFSFFVLPAHCASFTYSDHVGTFCLDPLSFPSNAMIPPMGFTIPGWGDLNFLHGPWQSGILGETCINHGNRLTGFES
jgi:hypothetical protein